MGKNYPKFNRAERRWKLEVLKKPRVKYIQKSLEEDLHFHNLVLYSPFYNFWNSKYKYRKLKGKVKRISEYLPRDNNYEKLVRRVYSRTCGNGYKGWDRSYYIQKLYGNTEPKNNKRLRLQLEDEKKYYLGNGEIKEENKYIDFLRDLNKGSAYELSL